MLLDKIKIRCIYLDSIGFNCWIIDGDHGFRQIFWSPSEAVEFASYVYQSQLESSNLKEALECL